MTPEKQRLSAEARAMKREKNWGLGMDQFREKIIRPIRLSRVGGQHPSLSFTNEPTNKVLFYNNTGTVLQCSTSGSPGPTTEWLTEEGLPVTEVQGLRQIRPDGSLVFLPFRAEEYRLDVHATVYRCRASSALGSIISRPSAIRAVIYQKYEIRVYDEYVIRGNCAVLRCHVPSYVKDYVVVTSWIGQEGLVIFPQSAIDVNSKYSVFPTGELLVRNVQFEDNRVLFKCHVRNMLSGHTESTPSGGRLIVTEPHTSVPPRMTHSTHQVTCRSGEAATLPCVAQGYPVPRAQWFRSSGSQLEYLHLGHRYKQQDGLLLIHHVNTDDSGVYVCLASNDVGDEKVEIKLSVTVSVAVSMIPRRQEANKGMQVTFNCSVSGHPLDRVQWYKDTEPLSADRRRTFLSRTVLHISSVEQKDRGSYQCFAANDETSAQATALLLVLSEPPLLLHTFNETLSRPGETVSLRCSATGNPLPQITWTSFGQPVRDSHNLRLGDYVSRDGAVVSFVNFTNLDLADGGIYECRVENDFGLVTHRARLKVMGKPYIRDMSNRTAIAGRSVTVICPVTSHPVHRITWEKGGKQLPLGRRHKVSANGTLVIQDVDRSEDSGRYTCNAENTPADKTHKDMYLKVLVPPTITPIVVPSGLQEGMRTSLTCSVPTGDSPIRLAWLKEGQAFAVEPGVTSETIDDFISTLVFKSLRQEHSGLYSCLAANEAAQVNFTVSLQVNAPPRWKIEPHDVDVIVGVRLVLDCQASGKPEPRVLWKRSQGPSSQDFKTVISGSRVQTMMNGSLVFREVERDDSGRYMCEASNEVGPPLSTVLQLLVHVPVHFQQAFEVRVVQRGESVHLVCDAQGEEPITYLWFKEGQAIKSNAYLRVAELGIERADRLDTGLYSCMASNAYGQEKKTVQLTVQDRPDPPKDLQVVSVTSKSAVVMWKAQFQGNSPLTRYLLQIKKASEDWTTGPVKEVQTLGDQLEASFQDLTPMTDYHIRVIAENAVGRSPPSEPLTLTSDEEVPGEPPSSIHIASTGSRTLHATWKAPIPSQGNGRVKGYYVGYKILGSSDPFVYKTVKARAGSGDGECDVENLRRSTKYSIVIQAFNDRGAGPLSDEVVVETLDLDPPGPPILRASEVTPTSVHLTWHSDEEKTGEQITGYVLYYRLDGSDWLETPLAAGTNSYQVGDLSCGSKYQFYLAAHNRVGKGNPSEILEIRTEGNAPVAPNEKHLIIRNATSLALQLVSWKSRACPISHFVLEYKKENEAQWTLLSSNLRPEQEVVIVPDLSPGTWYHLLMSAHNAAGDTTEKYAVATLTLDGGTVEPTLLDERASASSKLASWSLIVPITSSLLVLAAVASAVFFLLCKRRVSRPNNTIYEGTNNQHEHHYACVRSNDGGKGESIVMGEIEKPYDRGGCRGEPLYFPSPYAASKIPPGGRDPMSDSPRSMGGGGRPAHVYDVPQPRVHEDSCSNYQLSPSSIGRVNGIYAAPNTHYVAELEDKFINYNRERKGRVPHPDAVSLRLHDSGKRWTSPLYSEKPRYRSDISLRYGVYPQLAAADLELSDTECDQDLNDLYESGNRNLGVHFYA